MNQLAAPFRQLVERRLWPLALLLLLALAAVPFLLAKSEEPAPIPTPVAAVPNTTDASALAAQPIVSVGAPEARDNRRKVLGSRKDPFKPAKSPKKAKTATEQAKSTAPQKASALPKTDQALANAITNLVTVQKAKKTYELYSLTVRFGDSAAPNRPARNLKRLKAMPSVAEPAFIYLGLLEDHKTAVFLVDANAKVQGDGKCMPNPDNCQTLHMKVGDIAFFDMVTPGADGTDAVGAQYQLDLVRIRKKTTTDREEAAKARASEANGGRRALRTRAGRINGYRYSRTSGTVAKAQ